MIHKIADTPGQPNQESWLVFADGDLWSAQASAGIVDKIDPVTNARVARASLDGWLSDLAVGGGFVWVSKVPDGVVYKLSPDDLSVLASVPAGADPERITATGTEVWVANTAPSGLSTLTGDNGSRQGIEDRQSAGYRRVSQRLVWSAAVRTPPALPPINGFEVNISTPTWEFSPDPTHQHSTLEYQLDAATCSNLLRYPDGSSQLVPEIAAAMPVLSNGGRTYTFTIRSGYRFSPPSNQPVTAETFARTIERALWPKLTRRLPRTGCPTWSAPTRSRAGRRPMCPGSPRVATGSRSRSSSPRATFSRDSRCRTSAPSRRRRLPFR